MNDATHLTGEQALRLAHGELSESDASRLGPHVEQCPECQARVKEMLSIDERYAAYEREWSKVLPAPPRPWAELPARGARIVAMPARRWLAAAAAILMAVLAVRYLQSPPRVSAAELLEKARAAAPLAAPAKRIQVKTRRRALVRPASLDGQSLPDAADLAALFRAARFNWEAPLSAASFSAWRDQLERKEDFVEQLEGEYRIRTKSEEGSLAEATLTLRKDDLRPVRETFQFRPDEWVEISEVFGETPVEAPKPEVPAVTAVPAPDEAFSAAEQELAVVEALHRLGADLGEPIELARDGRQLRVVATGLPAQRQEQLRAALESVRGVTLEIGAVQTMQSAPVRTGPARSTARRAPRLPVERLGEGVNIEDWTNRLLDASEAAVARAHAIRALGARFPANVASQLDPSGRDRLAAIRRDHLEALQARTAEMRQLLEPVLGPVPRGSGGAAGESLVAAALAVDHALVSLLAGTEDSAAATPAALAAALANLEAQVEAAR